MAEGKKSTQTKGIRLGGGVTGKYLFRIREQHIADHLIPLMRARAVGAAKLDLVLRCVGLQEDHAGQRQPGYVLPSYSWEQLHNLARGSDLVGSAPPEFDASSEAVRLKRKWVGAQLARLESLGLVRRLPKPGRRPELVVLRDDGSEKPLDDPTGGNENSYITVLGGIIGSGTLASWDTSELSAYLAATVAERLHPKTSNAEARIGGGQWFRSLGWFADIERRYELTGRTRLPFSTPTLERGIAGLEEAGLISHQRILRDPRNGKRLQGPRNLYKNHFDTLADSSSRSRV